jgi:acetylornithine/N-succinyldiaminopimelate aminotransferase
MSTATLACQSKGGSALHMDQYGGGRLPFLCVGGEGVHQHMVSSSEGRTIDVIDASGGYASACLGANHPIIRERLPEALKQGYSTDEVEHDTRDRMLEYLFGAEGLWIKQFPYPEYHVAGRNSGSEGVELALRLAVETRFDYRNQRIHKQHRDRHVVLAYEGAWHGWTSGLIPLLNRRHYRVGLISNSSGTYEGVTVMHIPFGSPERLQDCFEAHGRQILAVVLEPIQGDAGILSPPAGYLRQVRELCDEYESLLIADEVLTFSKTGQYFAMSDGGVPVQTDISVIGKSLGMGVVSTSLVVARTGLKVRPSGAVSTSDLRPFTCEIIRGGIEFLEKADLVSRAAERGRKLREVLENQLVSAYPSVYSEVRGQGFMNGVELSEAAAPHVRALRLDLLHAGVYIEVMAGAGKRTGGQRYVFPTLRVAPPLVISDSDLRSLVECMIAGTHNFLSRHLW